MELVQEKHECLMAIVLLGRNHVLKHCAFESLTEVMNKAARSQISRCASRPEITHKFLVCATEDGIGLVALVDPSIRMLVKEYREIGNMTEALKAGI